MQTDSQMKRVNSLSDTHTTRTHTHAHRAYTLYGITPYQSTSRATWTPLRARFQHDQCPRLTKQKERRPPCPQYSTLTKHVSCTYMPTKSTIITRELAMTLPHCLTVQGRYTETHSHTDTVACIYKHGNGTELKWEVCEILFTER